MKPNSLKRTHAEDVAGALADGTDTLLDFRDVHGMSDASLFDYLETLGYQWTGSEWENTEKEKP